VVAFFYEGETTMRGMKLFVIAGAACVLASLHGCMTSEPNGAAVMTQVKPGMTKDEVVDRLGPPDGNWGPWHSQCIEYGFGRYAKDRYAVYVNNQSRVVLVEHAGCNVKRAEEAGLR
jgi:hypothetical protein